MVERFEVTAGGRVYRCSRTITGARGLRQSVHVEGCGSKSDPAEYGRDGHPESSMAGVAMLIAHELIREAKA
ncbi:MAG: hypothetical protein M3N82_02770 [Pseudomonadota bacterium]|nr:hypothetical protein [Pseudomonadota bacterium]